MNRQGKQIVIDAINKVISSSPKPYNPGIFSNIHNNTNNNDISKQQFEIWTNYVFEVLNISYSNLGFPFILSTDANIKNKIQQFNQYNLFNQFTQNKMTYIQLVYEINNELLTLIQAIIQY